MNWNKKQLIGFSVKDMEEMQRVVSLGINLVEIKLHKFAKAGTSLYFYKNRQFIHDKKVLHELSLFKKSNKIEIQFHLPLEKGIDLDEEKGINVGINGHHRTALERFAMLELIYREYKIGSVITMHPPEIFRNGEELVNEEESLKNAKIFFEKLDEIRFREGHSTAIGIENQVDIKKLSGNLGYIPNHFKIMLRDTRTIGLTIDTGHRNLAENFTVREFMQLGFLTVNFHFHGNNGDFNSDNYNDDEHLLPNKYNIKGYENYLRYFRRHRTPVVLEISHLERYSDNELKEFVSNLKEELN